MASAYIYYAPCIKCKRCTPCLTKLVKNGSVSSTVGDAKHSLSEEIHAYTATATACTPSSSSRNSRTPRDNVVRGGGSPPPAVSDCCCPAGEGPRIDHRECHVCTRVIEKHGSASSTLSNFDSNFDSPPSPMLSQLNLDKQQQRYSSPLDRYLNSGHDEQSCIWAPTAGRLNISPRRRS